MDALSTIGSYANAGISSAKTAVISGLTYISNAAVDFFRNMQTAAQNAYKFTATKAAENPKVTKAAIAIIGLGALGGAAYAGRAHLPAMPAAISKLYK